MSDDPVTAAELLKGLEFQPLPESWSVLEALVLVKAIDENGDPSWAYRTTAGISEEELLGALIVRAELIKQALIEEWDE